MSKQQTVDYGAANFLLGCAVFALVMICGWLMFSRSDLSARVDSLSAKLEEERSDPGPNGTSIDFNGAMVTRIVRLKCDLMSSLPKGSRLELDGNAIYEWEDCRPESMREAAK